MIKDDAFIDGFVSHMAQKGCVLQKLSDISYGVKLNFTCPCGESSVNIYQNNKGKITIDASRVKDELLRAHAASYGLEAFAGGGVLLAPPLIGSDEAGKGDYFGPLSVCAVYADEKTYSSLLALGVKDSKKLSDSRMEKLVAEMKRLGLVCAAIRIGPERFNEMYKNSPNINVLLSWAHAAAIKKVAEKTGCKNVLIDRFSSEYRMENNLKGLGLNIVQLPRAEQNAAVAAASIIARCNYMAALKELSREYGVELCPGAGEAADSAAREFVRAHGADMLKKAAKISYANTKKVTG